MDYTVLKDELEDGKRLNLYVFTGEERELMRKYIKRIDREAKEADSFKDLIVRFQNTGLFSAKAQTFFIWNDKEILDMDLSDIVRKIQKNVVVLLFDSLDKRSKFYKAARIYEFPKLGADTLRKHIQQTIDIDDNAALYLCKLCSNDLARVDLECDKLSRLGVQITTNLIHDLVIKQAEDVIFDMIKAVAKRTPKRAYELLQELLERKESPIKIISLLYTQFRNILIVQSYRQLANADIAAKTGLSTGQIYHIRDLTDSFALEDLCEHLQNIQQAEVSIKTGKLDQFTALDALLINILR